MKRPVSAALACLLLLACKEKNETALAHPPFDAFYACTEHFAGQLSDLGDALGTDCVVQRLVNVDGRLWGRAYADAGEKNEDWYGWHYDVLSPCRCTVEAVQENPQQNEPGKPGSPPASHIVLRRADGVYFMLAHVRSPTVKKGDNVEEGQSIAKVGNNGYSRTPHIHIGAWKADKPLQIRFDQNKMRMPTEYRQEAQQAAPGDGLASLGRP